MYLFAIPFLFPFNMCSEVGSLVVVVCNFGGTSALFSIVAVPVYGLTHGAQCLPFPNILPAFVLSYLFDNSHSNRGELMPCGFDLHFSDDQEG